MLAGRFAPKQQFQMEGNMKRLEALSKYFYGGQAESEKSIVSDIFVFPDKIDEITNFSFLNYKVVIGPKGSGKSLLLEFINQYYLESNIISMIIRPKDLDSDAIADKKLVTEKIKEAERQIVDLIKDRIKKSFESSSDKGTLLPVIAKAAEISEQYNLGEFITELLPENYSRIVRAFSSLQKNKSFEKREDEIAKHLTKTNKKFILMLDDLDKIVEEGRPENIYSTSWSIIEAAFELANQINDISVIVVSRTDVWHLMTKVHKYGQSIFDKIQNPFSLYVDDNFLERIFRQRIKLAYDEACSIPRPTYEIDYFFEPSSIGFYGKTEIYRPWSQWVAKNTRNRARDMIQLMQLLITRTEAITNDKDSKITDAILHDCLEDYAKSRINNLKIEYGKIMPRIDDVIYKIKKTRYSFSEIRDWLISLTGIGITVDNIPTRQNEDKSMFSILRVLHMASVINPRIQINAKEYRHILFEEDQDFIDPNDISNLQNVTFELHPTFHCLVTKV